MTYLRSWLLFGSSIILFSSSALGAVPLKKEVLIAIGKDLKEVALPNNKQSVFDDDELAIVRVNESELERISHVAHEKFNRCGGFVKLNDTADAESFWSNRGLAFAAQKSRVLNYSINQEAQVTALLREVKEPSIRQVITKLSSYRNRYYTSDTGVESQVWLYNHWQKLAQNRSDVRVYKWKHDSWPQDTIVMEIAGKSSDKIVVGGHGDSVAGWWNRERSKAPGADDNASGIATISEIIKVLIDSNYQPQNTLVFASYAAEEVGLLGSREMAETFKSQGENVLGVLQLDMTNYNGSDWDIVLISDHTNEAQNKFLGALIDRYLPGLSWGYDRCGYACSDHASWTSQGYPASMPFEAKKGDSNRHIHSSRDTISQSNDRALHAQKFARLGVAFVVELDN
jgi:leucyl aminopeptidase